MADEYDKIKLRQEFLVWEECRVILAADYIIAGLI